MREMNEEEKVEKFVYLLIYAALCIGTVILSERIDRTMITDSALDCAFMWLGRLEVIALILGPATAILTLHSIHRESRATHVVLFESRRKLFLFQIKRLLKMCFILVTVAAVVFFIWGCFQKSSIVNWEKARSYYQVSMKDVEHNIFQVPLTLIVMHIFNVLRVFVPGALAIVMYWLMGSQVYSFLVVVGLSLGSMLLQGPPRAIARFLYNQGYSGPYVYTAYGDLRHFLWMCAAMAGTLLVILGAGIIIADRKEFSLEPTNLI